MLKKSITYKNLDDESVTEDFYFNLTKAELAEMEATFPGGLQNNLKKVVESQDPGEIFKVFKHLISSTVGKRSEDGKRFIKSQEITDDFMQTDAYSELVMSFFTGNSVMSNAAEFIAGVMPKDLVDKVDMPQIMARAQESMAEKAVPKSIGHYTHAELMEMPTEQFQQLLLASEGGLPKHVLQAALQRGNIFTVNKEV